MNKRLLFFPLLVLPSVFSNPCTWERKTRNLFGLLVFTSGRTEHVINHDAAACPSANSLLLLTGSGCALHSGSFLSSRAISFPMWKSCPRTSTVIYLELCGRFAVQAYKSKAECAGRHWSGEEDRDEGV